MDDVLEIGARPFFMWSLDWSYRDAELDCRELTESGWRLLTVSELVQAKGVILQDEVSYTDFWDESLCSGMVPRYTGGAAAH